jgi:hypothetical protein
MGQRTHIQPVARHNRVIPGAILEGRPVKEGSSAAVDRAGHGSGRPVASAPSRRYLNIAATLPKRIGLLEDSTVTTWRVVAKDGATVGDSQVGERAANMPIGVGETIDVDVHRTRPRRLSLDILTNAVELMHVPVIVR